MTPLPRAAATPPWSVLVVDDSAFMRIALRRIIEAEGDLRVVGEAGDGVAAVEAVSRLRPAVVAMDVEMPVLDGVEATRRIMRLEDPPPVVMVSQHTQHESPAALAALEAGAADYVSKETGLGAPDLAHLDRALRARLRYWAGARRAPLRPAAPPARPARELGAAPEAVLVAASTGGPDALAALLAASGPLPVPVVVAQHMPPALAPELAAHLARRGGWPVRVAENGAPLEPGAAALLPMDGALIRAGGALALRLAQGAGLVHPSADLLFRSAALLGLRAAAVVLTGMGTDGAAGAASLAGRGAPVLAQAPESAVVAGMPEATLVAVPGAPTGTPAELGARLKRWFAP
jgi:two-component system chemotaxis response regulator CheB